MLGELLRTVLSRPRPLLFGWCETSLLRGSTLWQRSRRWGTSDPTSNLERCAEPSEMSQQAERINQHSLILRKVTRTKAKQRRSYDAQQSIKTCRGTQLLDELATILPNLYSFSKDNDLEFASTILLLNRYWDNLKEHTANNSELRSEFIRILHKIAIVYGEVNIPVACGARVIACDVESSRLNDEEAQLVHCITGIHIDRATSIVQAKSPEA